MIRVFKDVDHRYNRAMVYMVDRDNIPSGVDIPRRDWVLKTVGNLSGIIFKRSDRRLIVVDMSTPTKLRRSLSRVRKMMYPSGFTSVAIPKQGKMSFKRFKSIADEILSSAVIDIELYDKLN